MKVKKMFSKVLVQTLEKVIFSLHHPFNLETIGQMNQVMSDRIATIRASYLLKAIDTRNNDFQHGDGATVREFEVQGSIPTPLDFFKRTCENYSIRIIANRIIIAAGLSLNNLITISSGLKLHKLFSMCIY